MSINKRTFVQATIAAAALFCSTVSTAKTEAVRIQRDEYGVPHIFADTVYGLFYGMGSALAEDQLYQIEILRRTAEGRVAEVLGAKFVALDRKTRQRIDRSSLARQYAALPRRDRDIFDGMAAGINQRIDAALADPRLMPKGFGDNGFKPEHWTAHDIIAVYVHSMALRFSDINAELDNLALLSRLCARGDTGAAHRLFGQLRWVSDDSAPTTISAADQRNLPVPTFVNGTSATCLPNGVKPLSTETLYGTPASALATATSSQVPHASNAWAASSRRLGPGRAALVNGPQMGDFAASYIWGVGLHGAGFNVVGSGPVGSPWLIFGSNGDIGWGATAGLGDTVDIYQEQLAPGQPHRYRFNGGWREMDRRDEEISVKGEEPQRLTVWSTIHGPIDLSDAANGVAYARKRSWAGSEVGSLVAWVHAMQAHDYNQWRAAVSQVSITVNNYFADKHGNIAYQFLGRFPVRPAAQDFRLPVTGDGTMEWRGTTSPLRNPAVFDPTSGLIANWNNKPQPSYHNSDFMFWSKVDRVSEIDTALQAIPAMSSEALWHVIEQTSFTDVTARYFTQLIRDNRAALAVDARRAPATALLADWDGVIADRSIGKAQPQYILYRAFLTRLLEHLFTPILPTGAGRQQAEQDYLKFDTVFPSLGVKIAHAALKGNDPGNLLQGERPAAVLAAALDRAIADVTARYGADPRNWSEPALPHTFSATNYAGVPISVDPVPLTMPVLHNRGTENNLILFDNGRMTSCDVTPPGQSGFIAPDGTPAAHYADQLGLYAAFGCKPQWLERADIDAHTRSTEELQASR